MSKTAILRRAASLCALGLLTSAPAAANETTFPFYADLFEFLYPNSDTLMNVEVAGSRCFLCHENANGGNGWNGYGWAIRTLVNMGVDGTNAIQAVEALDSDDDDDGVPNLVEILGGHQPGWTPGPNNEIFDANGTTTLGNTPPPGIAGTLDSPDMFQYLCNGDGGDQNGCTDCPCGNNAPEGTVGGCLNQSGTSAQLLPSDSASVSVADPGDLSFDLVGGNPNTLAVLTSGDALAPQSAANPCFGLGSGVTGSAVLDGLRCAVQASQRHGGRQMDSNGDVGVTNNGWGGANGPSPSIASQGGFVSGQTRYFQVFYRTDVALGCGNGQNTTQAVGVTFQP